MRLTKEERAQAYERKLANDWKLTIDGAEYALKMAAKCRRWLDFNMARRWLDQATAKIEQARVIALNSEWGKLSW